MVSLWSLSQQGRLSEFVDGNTGSPKLHSLHQNDNQELERISQREEEYLTVKNFDLNFHS